MRGAALALLLAIPRASSLPGPEGSALSASTRAGPSEPVQDGASRGEKPHKSPSSEPLDFRGPGREAPEPDVAEVTLGWFGPGDHGHPDFGAFWQGAVLALGHENAAGGYRGRPFRLVPAWSESPWKAGVVEVARLVHEGGAWAVLGGVDGATTHLAAQIALKSHLLLLTPGSTDTTTDRASVPWLFSLPPSDEAQAPVIAAAVAEAAGGGPVAVAAATDHDSHAALVAVRRLLAARRLTPASLVEFAPAEGEIASLAARLAEARPSALLVLAPPSAAGRLVAQMRGRGFAGKVVGGATLARRAFARAAGDAADEVLVPLGVEPGPAWSAFGREFEERWGEPPDEAAAHGYDAVRLVAAAVRGAGLNRARIRDAVRDLSPWAGISGAVSWNAVGRNERPVGLGAWRGGRLGAALDTR